MNTNVRRPLEEHLSVKAVADRLSLSERTIHRLIRQGRQSAGKAGIWPVRRVGGSTRIPVSAVNRCLDAGLL